jgi:ABC-2 type transport system permease protein
MTTTIPEPTVSKDAVRPVLASRRQRPQPRHPSQAALTFAWRAVLKIKHVPMQLFDVTAFPIMFTLLFTYLFGGALAGSPREYLQFLLPGIIVMNVVMITMYTGMALNTDISKGIFDRFRSLPIWRPAVLVGMLLADAARYTVAIAVMLTLGTVSASGPTAARRGAGAVALLLVFCFCLSWAWTVLGIKAQTPETVMQMSMTVLFPLTFASNVFVDPATMPGWVQAVVKVNPITHLADCLPGAHARRGGRQLDPVGPAVVGRIPGGVRAR